MKRIEMIFYLQPDLARVSHIYYRYGTFSVTLSLCLDF